MTSSAKMKSRIATIELQILKKTCQSIDSPRSLAVYLLAHYGEYDQLVRLEIDSDNYLSSSAFADDYLVTEMMKKTQALDLGIDREQVAYEKWLQAEAQCSQANDFLSLYSEDLIKPIKPETDSIIARAISICHKTLGSLTNRTLDTIFNNMEFGPGSTASVKGIVTRGRKFSNPILTTSQRLLSFGLFCIPPLWRSQVTGFVIQDHNELSFVPKNAKTNRAISVETDLNIFIQKGIGSMLKQKLRNLGIDTENQWKVNRTLVKTAYRDDLCTIDLSSASDTISYRLVELFVPFDWFELLNWARPEYTMYKGKLIPLEKFSGMGSGFTFELETLIFHSLLLAAKELGNSTSPVSTFGDDMICGNDIMVNVIDALSFLGLTVNSEKTFGKTAFHESCGADYFQDLSVRPFYLRYKNFDHEQQACIYLYCNLLRRYASHRNGGYTCDSRYLPAWLDCFTRLTKSARVFVPDFGFESAGVVGNLDEATPSVYRCGKSGTNLGWKFSGFVRPSVETRRYHEGAYIASLSKMTSFTRGREALRNRTKSGIYKNFYSATWIDLGPWV